MYDIIYIVQRRVFVLFKQEENGGRIDVKLAQVLGVTRAMAQKLIEENKVRVNGKLVKASYVLKLGDEVQTEELEVKTADIKPKDIKLNIIYEDNDVIIIDKDKDTVVHPGNGNYEDTIVNALMYSHKDELSGINGVIRPGIVHRIDKYTTGVIVVAKNDLAHQKLASQFKEHSITRKYIALVDGIVEKDKLRINLPIGRDEKNRIKMAVTTKNSKEAITNITVLKRYRKSGYTLVEARLETGRTHQIRVHMSYIGHALVGDSVYGKQKNEFDVEGQLLHAKVLGFVHPTTNEYAEFETEIHDDFRAVLDVLDKKEE